MLKLILKNRIQTKFEEDNQSDDGLVRAGSLALNQLPEFRPPNFLIDPKVEAKKYFLLEKKFDLIELNSKLETLDLFESNYC